jgi:type II secretory pathway component GspD/PulD (secretin)
VEYKKVGIELYTTPSVVNLDEQIMRIKAKAVVNLISGKETQNSLTAPQISSRQAETIMNIRSGDTIVIGGLFKEADIRSTSGLPLLSKIPLVGALFKVSTRSKSKTEIVIFITPTLIRPDAEHERVIIDGKTWDHKQQNSIDGIK